MSCPVRVKFYKDGEMVEELQGNCGWTPDWTFKYVLDGIEECIKLARESIPEASNMPLPSEFDWDEMEILGNVKSREEILNTLK